MSLPLFLRERRKSRKPTGYHVKFWFAQERGDGTWCGTGAGETYAHSLRELTRVIGLLNRRADLRAEVIPIWGPLAVPMA